MGIISFVKERINEIMSTLTQGITKPTIEYANIDKTLPLIIFTTHALRKMELYAELCSDEISWLGVVERDGDTFTITEVMLFEQKVTSATTEIDEGALSSFGSSLLASGQIDLFNKIRMWGHSHVNMAVFASGTDEATFEQFYKDCEYFIRVIINKKGDIKVDLVDCEKKLKYTNLGWTEEKTPDRIEMERIVGEQLAKEDAIVLAMKEILKEEVKACIIKPVSNFASGYPTTVQFRGATYGQATGTYLDGSGYGYDIDADTPDEDKKKLNYGVKILGAKGINIEVELDDIFSVEEIVLMAESFGDTLELRAELMGKHMYSRYTFYDWGLLMDTISAYYAEMPISGVELTEGGVA